MISYVRSGGISQGTSFTFDVGTADTNRLVTVHVGEESTVNASLSITVDGKSCTLVHDIVNLNGAGNYQEFWYIDEDGLGASNGTVTVALTGGNSNMGVIGLLHIGVDQSGPKDSNYDNTSVAVATVTVTGIDVTANGLVIAGWGEGTETLSINSQTSPLVERALYLPFSGDLFVSSGIESSLQTNKVYSVTFSADHNRATGIVASWDAAVIPPQNTHQIMM